MMQLILYDGWLQKAGEKVWDEKTRKMRPRMSRKQIRAIIELCTAAKEVKFLSNGILCQIK